VRLGTATLGLRGTQYCDKKYCDNFESWVSKSQGKRLTKNNSRYINKTQHQGMFF
jgi:hypothetical protein